MQNNEHLKWISLDITNMRTNKYTESLIQTIQETVMNNRDKGEKYPM
jgi:ATP/maltotriose-dependent transcriptional regulator MalT